MSRIDKYRALAHQMLDGIISAKVLIEKSEELNLDKKQLNLNFGGSANDK